MKKETMNQLFHPVRLTSGIESIRLTTIGRTMKYQVQSYQDLGFGGQNVKGSDASSSSSASPLFDPFSGAVVVASAAFGSPVFGSLGIGGGFGNGGPAQGGTTLSTWQLPHSATSWNCDTSPLLVPAPVSPVPATRTSCFPYEHVLPGGLPVEPGATCFVFGVVSDAVAMLT